MRKGYTLIELLVVIGSIAVLSTIVLFRFAGADQYAELQNATAAVTHDIRQVVTNAQQGRLLQNGDVVAGYGIRFQHEQNTRYILYANPSNVTSTQFEDGQSIILADRDFVATESLPHATIFSCNPMPCDLFLTTDQRTIFLNGTVATEELRVDIQNTKTNEQRSIRFDFRTSQVNEE